MGILNFEDLGVPGWGPVSICCKRSSSVVEHQNNFGGYPPTYEKADELLDSAGKTQNAAVKLHACLDP